MDGLLRAESGPTSAARPARPIRPTGRAALAAGLLGGSVAVLILLMGSTISDRPGFLDIVDNGVARYIPLNVFEQALRALGPMAKSLLFVGTTLAALALSGLLAVALVRLEVMPRGSAAIDSVVVAALAWFLAEAIVLPVFGAGVFGTSAGDIGGSLQLALAVASLAYGLVAVGILVGRESASGVAPAVGTDPPVGTEPTASAGTAASTDSITPVAPLGRRTFLGRSLVVVGLASFAGSVISIAGRLAHVLAAPPAVAPLASGGFGPTPDITPVDSFYTVDKDVSATVVSRASWRLSVSGLVDTPRSYTFDEIRALPAVEGIRTLQCISNQVVTWDGYISTQRWKGVMVRDVLAAVTPKPTAKYVLWKSADGYTESLPIGIALDERTWLAYELGPPGTLLTPDHGAPLRVLIAGRYGMKQPKYLTDIVVADHDEAGYYEQNGWDEQAIVRTYSRIDQPSNSGVVVSGTAFPVNGIASSGDRGISRVEVSADGGSTWQAAELEPPVSALSWVRWRTQVVAPGVGTLKLTVRATDGKGAVQDAAVRESLPSGASGYHQVTVRVQSEAQSPRS